MLIVVPLRKTTFCKEWVGIDVAKSAADNQVLFDLAPGRPGCMVCPLQDVSRRDHASIFMGVLMASFHFCRWGRRREFAPW